MRFFPEKYEELDIDKFDKQLMAAIKKWYRDNTVATFMLCCNPTKTAFGIVDIMSLAALNLLRKQQVNGRRL